MARQHIPLKLLAFAAILAVSGCGGFGSLGGLFGGGGDRAVAASEDTTPVDATAGTPPPIRTLTPTRTRSGFLGLGRKAADPTDSIQVNKYIWAAALDVLSFLPVQSADPFTGVIITGYGTPPGSGRAYRATIFIQDPALDARSLNVALQTRSGPASAATIRAIEDAILTRARQLRVGDGRL